MKHPLKFKPSLQSSIDDIVLWETILIENTVQSRGDNAGRVVNHTTSYELSVYDILNDYVTSQNYQSAERLVDRSLEKAINLITNFNVKELNQENKKYYDTLRTQYLETVKTGAETFIKIAIKTKNDYYTTKAIEVLKTFEVHRNEKKYGIPFVGKIIPYARKNLLSLLPQNEELRRFIVRQYIHEFGNEAAYKNLRNSDLAKTAKEIIKI